MITKILVVIDIMVAGTMYFVVSMIFKYWLTYLGTLLVPLSYVGFFHNRFISRP